MNIEPLFNLLKIYNDKHKVLMNYLPSDTTNLLINYIFVTENDDLFLNDRLIFINKRTGKFFKKGIIIKITQNKITIKTNHSNISLHKDKYYLFIKPRKNKLKKNNHKYFKELLNSLENNY